MVLQPIGSRPCGNPASCGSERVDYIRRLLRIEQAKAKERQGERTSDRNLTEVQRSDAATAEQFGISRDTMRREMFIADNADMLDPPDVPNLVHRATKPEPQERGASVCQPLESIC